MSKKSDQKAEQAVVPFQQANLTDVTTMKIEKSDLIAIFEQRARVRAGEVIQEIVNRIAAAKEVCASIKKEIDKVIDKERARLLKEVEPFTKLSKHPMKFEVSIGEDKGRGNAFFHPMLMMAEDISFLRRGCGSKNEPDHEFKRRTRAALIGHAENETCGSDHVYFELAVSKEFTKAYKELFAESAAAIKISDDLSQEKYKAEKKLEKLPEYVRTFQANLAEKALTGSVEGQAILGSIDEIFAQMVQTGQFDLNLLDKIQ